MALGIALGAVDLLLQRVLPYPWANLANSSAVWALGAFGVGWWLRARPLGVRPRPPQSAGSSGSPGGADDEPPKHMSDHLSDGRRRVVDAARLNG